MKLTHLLFGAPPVFKRDSLPLYPPIGKYETLAQYKASLRVHHSARGQYWYEWDYQGKPGCYQREGLAHFKNQAAKRLLKNQPEIEI